MPTRTEGDTLDGPCQTCGQRFVPWVAPDPIWNAVMGGDPFREAPGLLCPTCFCLRADPVLGQHTIWMMEPRS